MNVADALRREEYNDGEQIIQQVCGCTDVVMLLSQCYLH